MWGYLMGLGRFLVRFLPLVFVGWGLLFSGFVGGYLVGDLHRFPYNYLKEAHQTVIVVWEKITNAERIREVGAWSDVSPADLPKRRISAKHGIDDGAGFLLTGGKGQFLEYCPEHGCAAAIFPPFSPWNCCGQAQRLGAFSGPAWSVVSGWLRILTAMSS